MATNILAAVRQCPCLRGNVKFTAIEVAHRMNSSGFGRVAYAFMALKTGYSRRTAIRHMHRLVELGIVQKTVYKLANGYAINLYKCLLAVPAFYRVRAQQSTSDSLSSTLPTPKTEEKSLSLEEEIRLMRKGLRFLTDTESDIYKSCTEKIANLEALLEMG